MRYKFIIIFLCVNFSITAQKTELRSYAIVGVVKDSLNLPVEYAQILIQNSKEDILAYTQTDGIGHYSISYKTVLDSITLKVLRLGFTSKNIKISTQTKKQVIILKYAKENQLKEVVVKNRHPIEAKRDTINYLASAFSNGTETNVEDVLAKLPGVSVNKNTGEIKYQGKAIKKILLDGDDLTGQNYKVLTKNLSADWLEEVEILKHFTNNRLLHGIKQSEDVAINLKLKESAKAPLFGSLMGGGGTRSKYTSKAELLSYLKKLKLFTVGNANNIGVDLETYDMETYSSSHLEYKGFLFADHILQNELEPPSFFKEENFTFQEGQFISNVMVVKPSSKLNIRSFTTLYNNNLNFNYNDSLSYILPNNQNLSVVQSQNQNQKPLEIFQGLKLDYQLSKKENITSRIQFKRADKQLTSINETNFSSTQQKDKAKQHQFYGGLSYTNKLNTKWVMITDFQFDKNNLEEHLNLFDFSKNIKIVNQTIKQDYTNVGGYTNFMGKFNETFYGNLQLGWTKTFSDFNVSDLFSNNYKFENAFIELNLKKYIKKFRLSAGSRLRYINTLYNFQKNNQFLIEPTISVTFKDRLFKFLDAKFKGLYNTEYTFLKPSSLFDKELTTSFRSKVFYSANANIPTKNEFLVFSANISDNEKSYITTHIEWGYEKSDNTFSTSIFYDRDIVHNEFIQNGKTSTIFSVYSIDKYFQKLQTSVKFSYKSQIASSLLSIENKSGENRLKQHNINIIAGIVLTNKINLSTAYRYFYNQNNWLDSKTVFNYQNYVFKVIYNYSKSLRGNIAFQATDFGKNLGGINSIIEANIKYKPKNKKWLFEGHLSNLTNLNSIKISRIEPSFFSTTSYPLQPRFLLLTAKYRF